MIRTALGDLIFDTGWKTTLIVTLFEKIYKITVKAKAYFEKDGITDAQKNSITEFSKNKDRILNKIMADMKIYDENSENRFTPRTLLFNRDGSGAILFDDSEYPDEGIAACFFPDYNIVSQDDYL